MKKFWRRLMSKKKNDRLVVEPKDKGLAVFSYAGQGFAARIGDHTIDEVFDVAKEAIKKQMEKSDDPEQEVGQEVRSEEE